MTVARPLPLVLAAATGAAACATVQVAERKPDADLAWPLGQPRVRLERVLELERGPGGLGGLLGRGEEQQVFEGGPFGAAWDGPDLVVAEPAQGRLTRIDPRGRVSHSPAGRLGRPQALASCAVGLVVADTEGGRIGLLNRDLSLARWLATDLARPTGVACDGNRLYVVETGRHQVAVIDADGTRRELGGRGTAHGFFNYPTAIALAGDTLLVGDTLNFRIEEFDARTLEFRGSFGELGDAPGDMPRAKGLAIDSAGQVWVSDAYLDRVSLFSPEGHLLLVLGRPGSDPGEFAYPAGIAAAADGRVAVVESLNRRVQVFRLAPAAPIP